MLRQAGFLKNTVAAVLLAFCLMPLAWAQTEKAAPPPPADVLATMKPGGMSIRFIALPVGENGVASWAHLYTAFPKGSHAFTSGGELQSGPVTRADVEQGSAPSSPYYVDIFTRDKNKLERRSTVTLPWQGIPDGLETRWREPPKKRGLVLLPRFYHGNNFTYNVVPLDDALRPLGTQTFETMSDTAEPEYNTSLVFDRTDARGVMTVDVVVSEGEKKRTYRHTWNGTRFVDAEAAFFVIAVITKTRKEAEAFVKRHPLSNYEIVSTSDYQFLVPKKQYAVVLGRYHTQKEADDYIGVSQRGYLAKQAF